MDEDEQDPLIDADTIEIGDNLPGDLYFDEFGNLRKRIGGDESKTHSNPKALTFFSQICLYIQSFFRKLQWTWINSTHQAA